ncbi:MAG: acetate--CoA ligase [Bacteroidetes bacterium B1(2017)]|nr:MAG: acetate--CoA ligase [Bacteroidetes bacterium B1(2017)]
MIPVIKSFSQYQEEYQRSIDSPEQFWDEVAETFLWKKKWEKTLNWNFTEPKVEWFAGGKLNISENCLDRHIEARGEQTAIIWEPNNPADASRKVTYSELHVLVMKFANVLTSLGVKKGDRVCIYMPMIPEAAVAMLACARVGAIHSVVFAGFSSQSLTDRITDAECKVLLTADGMIRGEKKIDLKQIADEAMKNSPSIETCVVYNHKGFDITMQQGRDYDWQALMNTASNTHQAEEMDSEDPLFILYTSGSTGKPKGVLHTTAGYMVYTAYTFKNVFQYEDKDVFCCTADIGWVTGHSYIVYGPLLSGATTLMFEGIPSWPSPGRFWELIDKHQVNVFYTAPTAIRSLEVFGLEPFEGKNLSSLKVLGSVGEPINEEAWHWYHENVGKGKCPIVDTWWQTETGGILISPLANITPLKPAFATLPLPGVQLAIVDEKGQEVLGNSVEGNLCIKFPWPGMSRSIYGDHERFRTTYFSTYENKYFTGDGCKRDEDGYIRITGRVDDVINVSGHRIGTGEVEDAMNEHGYIIESAVVGYPHDIKGQGIWAFVICDREHHSYEELCAEAKAHVTKVIGPFARPDRIQVVKALPKTRSGKIMRRILRKIAEGDISNLGDTSTLIDPTVVDLIKAGAEEIR